MGPARWLETFRRMGRMAESIARPLAGTPRGQRSLGRGASGDTTVYMDRVLEDLVIKEARKAGNVRVISEELGSRDIGRPVCSLVADPLDGSINAKNGIGLYAVSYAIGPTEPTLGGIRLGYIRNLVSGQEYWAVRGRGAYRDGKRIRTGSGSEIGLLLLEVSPAPVRAMEASRRILDAAGKVRCLGSMAIDLCYVASGAASALVDLRGGMARTLDLSAGTLILEEAGGGATDAAGRPIGRLPVDLSTRTDLIASANWRLHRRLLELGR